MSRCFESRCTLPQKAGSLYCDSHTSIRWALYQTDSRRGGYDRSWQRKRARFLRENHLCVLCLPALVPATVADHYPIDRRTMYARGIKDLDAPHRLRALCRRCHNRETAKTQGNLSKSRRTMSPAEREWHKWASIRGTDEHGNIL